MTALQSKTLLLLKPRGFCAGVVRAIDIVRIALDAFGPPIYVRKEIVHNRYVVEELQAKGAIFVDEVEEVKRLEVPDPSRIAYITQTTLSLDETKDIIEALRKKFPLIEGPHAQDICYATQNRQTAVKDVAHQADLLLVVGSENSSNSNRLVEVSTNLGTPSYLIDTADDIKPEWLSGVKTVAV